MQDASRLLVRGTITNIKQSTFQEKTTTSLQFIRRDARAVSVMNVKVPDGYDMSGLTEGKEVELDVDVSAYENNVYFRLVEPARKRSSGTTATASAGARP